MELYFVALPIINNTVHHFETYNLVRAFGKVLVHRGFVKFVDIIESVGLNAVQVMTNDIFDFVHWILILSIEDYAFLRRL